MLSFREEPEVSHAPLTFWSGDNSREAQKQEKPRERTNDQKRKGIDSKRSTYQPSEPKKDVKIPN